MHGCDWCIRNFEKHGHRICPILELEQKGKLLESDDWGIAEDIEWVTY